MAEEKRLKKGQEAFKIYKEVFDRSTLLTLYTLINKGYIDEVHGAISTGKEANVFHGINEDNREIAVKIYRVATSEFRTKWSYLISDPRYRHVTKNPRKVVHMWAQREFSTLKSLFPKIKLPEPFVVLNNVVVMEFLGKNGLSYPLLKDTGPEDPEKDFEVVMNTVKTMYREGIVHADLSEYNILVYDTLYFIDFAQAAILDDPRAEEFLLRDLENVRHFFSRYCDVPETEDLLREVKEWKNM
ncbi:MAG: serine protein kinase RIO [Theionarchaea archaeon]|nr:serine protein kinase RIO [Theionarchaea archaeon]MBU7038065.1 serine protein kinase RIO [Theionarchaea archaeon]